MTGRELIGLIQSAKAEDAKLMMEGDFPGILVRCEARVEMATKMFPPRGVDVFPEAILILTRNKIGECPSAIAQDESEAERG